MIELKDLAPAEFEAWNLLLDLAEEDVERWTLVGGQMIKLIAAERSTELPRFTPDMDVVVNVRSHPRAAEWLAAWLDARDMKIEVSSDEIGHRFRRRSNSGHGDIVFDVLGPEGLKDRRNLFTLRPARTIEAPGGTQALYRSESVEVTIRGSAATDERTGIVRRPSLLGALIIKAAATSIPGRQNPDRDWQDSALLLSLIKEPLQMKEQCERKDRQRLRGLEPLMDESHQAWRSGTTHPDSYRLGSAALDLLIN